MGNKISRQKVVEGLIKVVQFLFTIGILILIIWGCQKLNAWRISLLPTDTPRPTPTATPIRVKENIVELLEAGKIEVKIRGAGIEEVELDIQKLIEEALEIKVPIGTYIVSQTESIQNMVIRNSTTFFLDDDEWITLDLEAACANMHRRVPYSNDNFEIVLAPDNSELGMLMTHIEEESSEGSLPYDVVQAAIWIVTDNASFDGLGTLQRTFGFNNSPYRAIGEDDCANALRLVDEAGIDITQKRIWEDRNLIIEGLLDPSLADWIIQRENQTDT